MTDYHYHHHHHYYHCPNLCGGSHDFWDNLVGCSECHRIRMKRLEQGLDAVRQLTADLQRLRIIK